MALPIWKDNYINLGTGDSAYFRIAVGTNVIYTGRAYKRPGESNIQVRINDICADYLASLSSLPYATLSAMTFPVTFIISKSTNGTSWSQVDTRQFFYDWSYDYAYDASTMGMTFPINGRFVIGMWIPYADPANIATIGYDMVYPWGRETEELDMVIADSFDSEKNEAFLRSFGSAGTSRLLLDSEDFYESITLKIGENVTYYHVESCAKYALYYLNAFGGWDFLLIEGNNSETDNLSRHERECEYNNATPGNRSARNYANELEKVITLHTGWLSDAQSARMHHLLNSTDVFLFEIATDTFTPVIITNTSTPHKTFKSEGGMVSYDIDVKVAHNMTRR